MSKRTTFTSITLLPKHVTRSAAVSWLHNHEQMIRLNPLVLRLQRTTPPPNSSADEYNCAWYEITDEISYLPGGLYKGEVSYKACFNDLPNGLQTHTFAPAGLDLRGKWTVGGNEPGEPREKLELGMDAPREGLYVREDVDMRCNIFLTGFVKKNLTKSHKSVVDKLAALGDQHEATLDEGIPQGHAYDNASAGAVPKPWHNGEQALTPVDSNTMFSPDSYLTNAQTKQAHHDEASVADLNPIVGQQPSPYIQKPRSHSRRLMYNLRAANPARSEPKLSYLEHERIRNTAPQLPPLEFLYPSDTRSQQPSGMPYGRASTGQLLTVGQIRDPHVNRRPFSVLYDASAQAELPAERSPQDRFQQIIEQPEVRHHTASDASALLKPSTHTTTQRLSTDFTWRPGSQPGALV